MVEVVFNLKKKNTYLFDLKKYKGIRLVFLEKSFFFRFFIFCSLFLFIHSFKFFLLTSINYTLSNLSLSFYFFFRFFYNNFLFIFEF